MTTCCIENNVGLDTNLEAKIAVAVLEISPAFPNAETLPGASLLLLNIACIEIGSGAAKFAPARIKYEDFKFN